MSQQISNQELICFCCFLNNQTKKLRAAVLDVLMDGTKNHQLDETQYYLVNKLIKDLTALGKWEFVRSALKAYLKAHHG